MKAVIGLGEGAMKTGHKEQGQGEGNSTILPFYDVSFIPCECISYSVN